MVIMDRAVSSSEEIAFFVVRGGGFDVPERHEHQPNRQHRGEEQISYRRRNANSRSCQSERAGAENSEHLRAVCEP